MMTNRRRMTRLVAAPKFGRAIHAPALPSAAVAYLFRSTNSRTGVAKVKRKMSLKLTTILWCILASAALMTGGAGCNRQRTVHKAISATAAFREIRASLDVPAGLYPDIDPGKGGYVDGPPAIYPENDAASIRFGSHDVRVEKERLLLDGKESAKIPATAARAEIVLSNAILTVSVESKNILTTRIERDD